MGLWHSADEEHPVNVPRRGKVAQLPRKVKLNITAWDCGAAVAQGTHNPLVVGSNPSGPK